MPPPPYSSFPSLRVRAVGKVDVYFGPGRKWIVGYDILTAANIQKGIIDRSLLREEMNPPKVAFFPPFSKGSRSGVLLPGLFFSFYTPCYSFLN